MLKNIRCHSHKALKEGNITLKNLGPLNVLVGRNGSGKSTILESISKNLYYESNTIDTILIQNIIEANKQTDYGIAWEWGRFDQDILEMVKNPLESLIGDQLFDDELLSYAEEIDSKIPEAHRRVYGNNPILERTKKIISKTPKPQKTFIPPKRDFKSNEIGRIIDDHDVISTSLIENLFHLKNKSKSSVEYIIYQKISTSFHNVTDASFDIILNKSEFVLQFRVNNTWLNATDCGLGYYDTLNIITRVISDSEDTILIEEPENHLHPDFQRRLLKFFKQQKDKQIILSTHSDIFADTTVIDSLHLCILEGKKLKVSNETSKSKILNELGYSVVERVASDAIILTEGPSDIPIIKSILSWLGALDKYKIKLWPLGGDLMGSDYMDLSIFGEPNKVFAIIDKDTGSNQPRKKFKKNAEKEGIKVLRLSRYAIENYFTSAAIKIAVPDLPVPDSINPNQKLEKQLGKDIKGRNAQIIEQMSLEDFEGTDLLKFLRKIHDQLEADYRKAEEEKAGT